MRSSMKLIWQACVVCLFLMVAVLVGTAGVTAYNPLDGTVAANFGTNTATVGQMLTPDANLNLYWTDVPTNSAGGGSGFPLTQNESAAGFGISNMNFFTFTTNATVQSAVSNAMTMNLRDVGGGEVRLEFVSWIETNAPVTNFIRLQQ